MERGSARLLILLTALLLLAAAVIPATSLPDALAEQLTTPTDLTTPEPAPTEVPKTGKRSGYAVIRSGAKVYTSRQRTSRVGTVTADSYVYIPNTTVNSLTYKIRFDTELSVGLDSCHTYYVLSEDVRWLSESECEAVERQLRQDDARETGGVLIPVIAFEYRNPPATPKATATPALTATPAPTVTPIPATATPELTATPAPATATPVPVTAPPAPSPTKTPVPIITPSPKPTATTETTTTPTPTATPGIATDTDLSTPVPTATPAPTATPGIATDTDLSTPVPTATPAPTATPGIATDTDLSTPVPTATPAPALMTAEEMCARLDETHPDRQVTLWMTCTEPGYPNGSRMTLFANVAGYDGLEYTVVWEVDKGDGNGYVNAGLDGMMSVSFIIDDENALWRWRAGVRMPYMEKE